MCGSRIRRSSRSSAGSIGGAAGPVTAGFWRPGEFEVVDGEVDVEEQAAGAAAAGGGAGHGGHQVAGGRAAVLAVQVSICEQATSTAHSQAVSSAVSITRRPLVMHPGGRRLLAAAGRVASPVHRVTSGVPKQAQLVVPLARVRVSLALLTGPVPTCAWWVRIAARRPMGGWPQALAAGPPLAG